MEESLIYSDLQATVERLFNLKIVGQTPIKQGWMNLKWRIDTADGQCLFLKQYHKKRFAAFVQSDLLVAFEQQQRLDQHGVPCPTLYAHQGDTLLCSDGGEIFMLMEHCPGRTIGPGKGSADQLYDLGRATGRMHRLLNDGTPPCKTRPVFMPPNRAERIALWNERIEQAMMAGDDRAGEMDLQAIEMQRKATESFVFEGQERLHPGWAHRDLWVDNLLFEGERLTAILDFDRLNYDYPQLDVARAVLSCALDEQLDVSLAAAFMAGYGETQPVQEGQLAHAMQWLWYMESPWWVKADMARYSAPPARFAKEMAWLAEHGRQLGAMLDGL